MPTQLGGLSHARAVVFPCLAVFKPPQPPDNALRSAWLFLSCPGRRKVTNLKKQDPGAKSIGRGGAAGGVSLPWFGYAIRRKLHRRLGRWDTRRDWLNPYLDCREWAIASPHEATYCTSTTRLCSNTRDAAVNGAAISHIRIPLLAATEIATHTPPRMARK